MAKENERLLGIKAPDILYLGCELGIFNTVEHNHTQLKNVIFIGNAMLRKGVKDIFQLAKMLSNVTFNIVGSGNGFDVPLEIKRLGLDNCVYHGTLSHSQMLASKNDV